MLPKNKYNENLTQLVFRNTQTLLAPYSMILELEQFAHSNEYDESCQKRKLWKVAKINWAIASAKTKDLLWSQPEE